MNNQTSICSVIIVSFRNFNETTGPCLKSLALSNESIEIIVVDNNSGASTQKLLNKAAQEDSRIKLILLDENKGFAAGNNIGVKAATSDLFLLLNTDTRVPADAISNLVSLMDRHPHWDMLGTMTNSSGNDQHIHTTGTDPIDILQQGSHWCKHSSGLHYHTDLLVFYCVMIKKILYLELQGLDEDFGLGYYEDTDFVYRAIKNKKQLVITEEVFVYHRGRGSFSKVNGAVRKLMKRNRKLFRKKHGHCENTAHWRDKNLQAMERYLENVTPHTVDIDLSYAFSNRRKLAETLMPNSPIKRFFYRRKLKNLIFRFKNILH